MFPSRRVPPAARRRRRRRRGLFVGRVGARTWAATETTACAHGDDHPPTAPCRDRRRHRRRHRRRCRRPTVAPLADLPPCPTEALDSADGPIDITFWHAMANDSRPPLIALTDAYNASQDKVRVELQNQTGYEPLIDKYINAEPGQPARPGAVPRVHAALDRRLATRLCPAAACIEIERLRHLDVRRRGHSTAYQSEGIQCGMPFNVSNPVLYYNRKMFEAAGLDPDDPPGQPRGAARRVASRSCRRARPPVAWSSTPAPTPAAAGSSSSGSAVRASRSPTTTTDGPRRRPRCSSTTPPASS